MFDALSQFRDAIRATGLEPPAVIEPGKLHRFPGVGKRNGNTAGWCKLFDDGLGGCFGDWSSGFSENWRAKWDKPFSRSERAAFMRRVIEARAQAEMKRKARQADAAADALRIWRATGPALSTPVETYLRSRGIHLALPPTIRSHSRLKHPTGGFWPGLVALVTRGADDLPQAVHRTFLSHDGAGKAPAEPSKMMLGPCGGGAVRLAVADQSLMVGEGIETCLAAMQATGRPAWAALSTFGLRTLVLPAEVRDVIVLADGDEPGEAAALDAARQWKREGRRVRIARPPRGMDFNDVLLGRLALEHEETA